LTAVETDPCELGVQMYGQREWR